MLDEFHHNSITIYTLSMHKLLNGQLAEQPTILDSILTRVVNTTSTPTRWEGGGWVGSHKVANKGHVFMENSQMGSTGVICTSTHHMKQLNPWPNPPAGCVAIYSWLSACPLEVEPFKDHPTIHGCLTGLRNKPHQRQLG